MKLLLGTLIPVYAWVIFTHLTPFPAAQGPPTPSPVVSPTPYWLCVKDNLDYPEDENGQCVYVTPSPKKTP
jgi:hypothetical protein